MPEGAPSASAIGSQATWPASCYSTAIASEPSQQAQLSSFTPLTVMNPSPKHLERGRVGSDSQFEAVAHLGGKGWLQRPGAPGHVAFAVRLSKADEGHLSSLSCSRSTGPQPTFYCSQLKCVFLPQLI